MQQENKSKTAGRLFGSVVAIVALSLCLVFTSFALVYSMVSAEDQLFQIGAVQINLNDGAPMMSEDEFLFEPGMTVKKEFFVKNESTCNVYYKLYFQNISGGLAEILEVEICDGDKILFAGTPATLTRTNVTAADDLLQLNEQRDLQIYFHFPEESGNQAQNLYLNFDFAVDAVQAKNNPDRNFE